MLILHPGDWLALPFEKKDDLDGLYKAIVRTNVMSQNSEIFGRGRHMYQSQKVCFRVCIYIYNAYV